MYVVPVFNIVNVSCLFFYGLIGHFKNIPLLSSRFLSRTLQNRSSLVNHLTSRKQNLAFASAPPMAALTKLFLSIPVCVMEKNVSKYQLLTARAISDQGICNSAKQ